jgi:hypothetical protein
VVAKPNHQAATSEVHEASKLERCIEGTGAPPFEWQIGQRSSVVVAHFEHATVVTTREKDINREIRVMMSGAGHDHHSTMEEAR